MFLTHETQGRTFRIILRPTGFPKKSAKPPVSAEYGAIDLFLPAIGRYDPAPSFAGLAGRLTPVVMVRDVSGNSQAKVQGRTHPCCCPAPAESVS